MNGILSAVNREIDRVRQQLSSIVRRGQLAMVTAKYFCQVEAFGGERFNNIELWQQYGIASRPEKGSEVLLIKLGGRGESAIVIATQNRAHRPDDLESGETVTYGKGAAGGQAQVRHRPDGTLALQSATGKTINVGGDVEAILRGTSFNAQLETLHDLWSDYLVALASIQSEWATAASTSIPWVPQGPTQTAFATALADLAAGITAYKSTADSLLSSVGRVE